MHSSPTLSLVQNPGFPWVPIVVGYYYYGFSLFIRFFPYISQTIGPTAKTDFRFGFYIKKNMKEKWILHFICPKA